MNEHEQHPDDLLPWYVNNTLADDEKTQVEAHLEHCEHCRKELVLLQAMRSSEKDIAQVPSEFAWQRLKRDMRQQPSVQAKTTRRWLPSLAAAAMLVIVVQTVLLVNVVKDNGFIPAGTELTGAVAQIQFKSHVTEQQLREVLQAVNAEIVSGPTAAGVYRIRLSEDKQDPVVQEKMAKLKSYTDVIDYIERD